MLPSWVSYCRIDDLAIFLDVRHDRYHAIAWESARSLIDPGDTKIPAQLARQIDALGWFDDPSAQRSKMPPDGSLLVEFSFDQAAKKPTGASILRALWRLATTRAGLATRSLERNLAAVGVRNRSARERWQSGQSGQAGMVCELTAFRVAERYALTSDTCLLRSLALHGILARQGIATSVVFGVKLHPFEAHCWVQQDATLLNDTVERTGMFVPIRVVD